MKQCSAGVTIELPINEREANMDSFWYVLVCFLFGLLFFFFIISICRHVSKIEMSRKYEELNSCNHATTWRSIASRSHLVEGNSTG